MRIIFSYFCVLLLCFSCAKSLETDKEWPEIAVCKWLHNAPCCVFLAFDDTNVAHINIAKLLNQYELKGSFYIYTYNLRETTINNYKEIIAMGHEVGNHTVNHVNLKTVDKDSVIYEICTAKRILEEIFDRKIASFAYPFGVLAVNDVVREVVWGNEMFIKRESEYFKGLRPTTILYQESDINAIISDFYENISTNNLYGIMGHGIDGRGWSPVSSEFFHELFQHIQKARDEKGIWVTTYCEGALYESLFHEVKIHWTVDLMAKKLNIYFDVPKKSIYNNFDTLYYSFKIDKDDLYQINLLELEDVIELDNSYIITLDLKKEQSLSLSYDQLSLIN